MPKIAHSIGLSPPRLPYDDAINRIWLSLEKHGAIGGGEYELNWIAPNDEEIKEVANKTGLPRDRVPEITEPNSTYNSATLPIWIDTHEILISIDYRYNLIEYGLIFMGNALNNPGVTWLTKLMGELVTALEIDCALLKQAGDEGREIYRRRRAGESLLYITLERLRGKSELGYPSLALLRADRVESDIWGIATEANLQVSFMLGDLVVFSSV